MEVRPKADKGLGWVFRPDADTVAALGRGVAKIRKHPGLGGERPHYGGLLARNEEGRLVEASSIKAVRRKRRKKVAKKVSSASKKKTVSAKKTNGASSKKRTMAAAPTSKKRTEVASGKMIALKTICADMELDPKAARVKLRRLIAKGDIDWHDHSQRWEFTPARAKEVRAHLAA